MPDIQSAFDQVMYELVMEHLGKLATYVPGPIKNAGGEKSKLLERYREDPLFSVFGLDTPEYLGATLAGGSVTSLHRKLGDIYEACVRAIFVECLEQLPEDVSYQATIRSGDEPETRSVDAYLQFDKLPRAARKRVQRWCQAELNQLAAQPRIDLIGVGFEVRHCYQTGDHKRTQADEAMARHLLVSGILPVMPLFCNQSNPSIIRRYRSVWVTKQGMESYDLIREFSGYDFFDFLSRNRDDFRRIVLTLLRSLIS